MTHDAPVFIGDELTASGYRLAGARTLTPLPEELAETFRHACSEALVVLLTSATATHLPQGALQAARSSGCNVLVVDDMLQGKAAPDFGAIVRRQLGMGP